MIKEIGGRKSFVAQSEWTDKAFETIRREDVKAIRLSQYAGWNESNISFLGKLAHIEHVELWSTNVRDISPLYSLGKLKSLSIDGVKCPIDFGKMQSLDDIHIGHWKENLHDSVFSMRGLKNLALNHYSGSLSRMARLASLENLAISYSKIETLEGIGESSQLIRLSLARVHQLASLDGIEPLKKLKLLWIEGARRLSSIDSVRSLKSLLTLNISDCPALESLRPIEDLKSVEAVWFFGTTRIKDGDLCPLAVLPRLRYSKFVDRKSYSHKSSEFPKNLDFFK